MRVRRLRWALLLAVVACPPAASRGAAQDDRARALIDGLRAEDVEVRRASANALQAADAGVRKAALDAMIDRLRNEKDGQVRLAVFEAVKALGPDAAPAVPALVHTLRTDAGGQRLEETHQDYRAALALAAIGKPAVAELRGLLAGGEQENVRAEAVMALGRIGAEAGDAVPDLVRLLGDASERVRREAPRALGAVGPDAAGPLIDAAASPDATIRAGAVEGLGYLPAADESVRRAVGDHARDALPAVRAAAMRSLARLAVPDDVLLPILGENLGHEAEAVRRASVDLLVGRRPLLATMAPDLEALLASRDEGVSRHAAFLLGAIGPDAAPRLLDALRRGEGRVDVIAGALAQIGRPVAASLLHAVEAPEPRVRRGAALALGQIRPPVPDAVQALTAGLDDPDTAVKADFLAAIGHLGPRARDAVPALRARLRDDAPEIRVQAIGVLAEAAPRDEALLGDLTARLDDADARVQRRAIDAVRALGPPGRKALPIVIGKLRSPDREVRVAAAELIGSHGPAAADAVPALVALTDDPMPEQRALAAQTLRKLGRTAQPAFDRLAALLAETQPVEVREAAALAIGGLGLEVETLRPHLARALRDDAPAVRRAAMASIQKLGPQGAIMLPDLIALAERKEDLATVQRMLRRFERKGPDARSLPELVKQLDHGPDAVRLLAIKFLGLAGGRAHDAIPALERLRDDPSTEVRKQAEAACERIKHDAAPEPAR